ncbi:SEC-C domain-containing protein [Pullulanibacillus camelliae]|uniref:SEC-C domain-containing protein n=1 Tax=Pullulanibacillus camelliae TaxID=1707096 RepID=UPI001E4814F6|nr:SEC-C domain-containing protein [Pullulanibacillus camelliae]
MKRNDPCPCGSGKKYKQCCLSKASLDTDRSSQINEKEILLYKKLGLRPQTLTSFYGKEIVAFFKAHNTLSTEESKALHDTLYLFVEFIENEHLSSWQDFNREIWEKLLTFSYLDLAYEQTQAQAKTFYKTILNFVQWLKDNEEVMLQCEDWVKEIEQCHEEALLGAVRVLELYRGQVETPFLNGYEDLRREALFEQVGTKQVSEGVFEVIDKADEWMTCKSLLTKQTFNVYLSKLATNDVQIGTIFMGVIKQIQLDAWEILTLDRVFPSAAQSYLYKAIGVR